VLGERRRIPEVHCQEGFAVIEHPSTATLLSRPFGPDRKDGRRGHGARHTQHAEDVLDGIVEMERGTIERDHTPQRGRGRRE
jgi:hypothetical protein